MAPGIVKAAAEVALPPERALALWTDVGRWPSLVEGFARISEISQDWPEPGSKVVWESRPGGRGRVTETVLQRDIRRFTTRIYEQRLIGTQTAEVEPAEGGSRVDLRLEYELQKGGPLRGLTDLIFIRRALRDAMVRSLHRFAVEADEDAGLRGEPAPPLR
jgi:hypothetical protein